jgi:malate dehydrogenase
MTIWGNHSSTQYPDFYNARINGRPAVNVINDDAWLKDTFVTTVQQRGAAILKARGLSSAASAANAVIRGVQCLVNDTPEDETFSMCISSQGEYKVDEGLIFSFPCERKNGEISVVQDLPFNDYSMAKFNATLDELRQERDMVKSLGLLD